MKTIALAVATLSICLCGCLHVPTTKVSGNIGGQKFSGAFPKDADVTDLEVSAQTNGTVKMHIGTLKTRMNPDVVQQSANGQALIVTAAMNGAGTIAGDITQKALQAFMAQYGVPPAAAPATANPATPSVTATNK